MKEERRFRVSQYEIERDEEKRDGGKGREKPYEREEIALEEERRKVRRLRESGKTWLCRGELEKR